MGIGTKLKHVLSGGSGDENSFEHQPRSSVSDIRKPPPGSFPTDDVPRSHIKKNSIQDDVPRSHTKKNSIQDDVPRSHTKKNSIHDIDSTTTVSSTGRGSRGEGLTSTAASEYTVGQTSKPPDARRDYLEGGAVGASGTTGVHHSEPVEDQRDYFHGVAIRTSGTHHGELGHDDGLGSGSMKGRDETRSIGHHQAPQHKQPSPSANRNLPDMPTTKAPTSSTHNKMSKNAGHQQQPVYWGDSSGRDSSSVREEYRTATAIPVRGERSGDKNDVGVDDGSASGRVSGHYQHAVEVTDEWYNTGSRSRGTKASPPRRRPVDANTNAADTGARAGAAVQGTGGSSTMDPYNAHSGLAQHPVANETVRGGRVHPAGGWAQGGRAPSGEGEDDDDVDDDDDDDDDGTNTSDRQNVNYHKPFSLPLQQPSPEPASRARTVQWKKDKVPRQQPRQQQQQQFGSDHGSGSAGVGGGGGLGEDHYGPGHPGAKVMHQCQHCGEDNDISKYFRKEAVYRMAA